MARKLSRKIQKFLQINGRTLKTVPIILSPTLISSRIYKKSVTAWICNKKVINLIHLIQSCPIKFATISHGIRSSVNNFTSKNLI
jgi:hypothetical protein